jgi:hypothetical protein
MWRLKIEEITIQKFNIFPLKKFSNFVFEFLTQQANICQKFQQIHDWKCLDFFQLFQMTNFNKY